MKHVTTEIRIKGQINRRIVCNRVDDSGPDLRFLASDGLTLFSVHKGDVVWHRVRKPGGRKVGVKRRFSPGGVAILVGANQWLDRRRR